MSYDLNKKTTHSRDLLARYFGPRSSAKLAQELRQSDPSLYDSMRKESEQIGLVDQRTYFRTSDLPPDPNAPVKFNTEEITARALYDEAECQRLFQSTGSMNNAAKLAETDPAAYRAAKISSITRGILPKSSYPAPLPTSPVVEKTDTTVAIGAEMAATLNLPADYRAADYAELGSLIKAAADVKHIKAERETAAQAKAEAQAAAAAESVKELV